MNMNFTQIYCAKFDQHLDVKAGCVELKALSRLISITSLLTASVAPPAGDTQNSFSHRIVQWSSVRRLRVSRPDFDPEAKTSWSSSWTEWSSATWSWRCSPSQSALGFSQVSVEISRTDGSVFVRSAVCPCVCVYSVTVFTHCCHYLQCSSVSLRPAGRYLIVSGGPTTSWRSWSWEIWSESVWRRSARMRRPERSSPSPNNWWGIELVLEENETLQTDMKPWVFEMRQINSRRADANLTHSPAVFQEEFWKRYTGKPD